ncbi:aromatic acid exporter family protein [Alkalihalobacillus sp. BA299]|uniref:FUSC family protein n=1 Tax=Alkalihalobacillus sp. BA299 TaxID=2815938 RepID=UPI001ADBA41B|nr:aromatic acid exporter family protein [Alkalihalobacillus sp. BA299]
MRSTKWIGRRVLKTGLSVFVTAFICKLMDLPIVFAIITAIVTTEPTAADSLKKGVIRLPAAALGALFAVLLEFLIGQSALTYSLVAMLTIVACARLKLDTGTLVATLTAVAMIPGTTDNMLHDFIFRLSGTSIGIIVSTCVNYVVLPPKFGPIVVQQIETLYSEAANKLMSLLYNETEEHPFITYRPLSQQIEKIYQLTQFQSDEWKYRHFEENEFRSFQYLLKKLHFIEQINLRIGNLTYLRIKRSYFSDFEWDLLKKAISTLADIYKDPLHQIKDCHQEWMKIIKENLHYMEYDDTDLLFVQKVFYELYIIQQLTIELADVTEREKRFSLSEQSYPSYVFPTEVQYD